MNIAYYASSRNVVGVSVKLRDMCSHDSGDAVLQLL